MGRILARVGAVGVLLVGIAAVYLYNQLTSFEVEQVSDRVHVIYQRRSLGGNAAVLRTDEGAVVVDTMAFGLQGREMRELAEKLGGGPTQAIINTHYHSDHCHGNPAFAAGARVVATERTRDYLLYFDGDYWDGRNGETLPNDTFEHTHEMKVGGHTIRSYHVGRGHTGGDLVVLFVEERVLHAGDLFYHRTYPNIDLEAGGSAREWDTTLDRVLALNFEKVIPGHGRVTDREGLLAFQRFMRELWREVEATARAGTSLEETLSTVELIEDTGYDVRSFPFVFRVDREFAIRRVFEEATGAARAREIPRAGDR